jgi:hypothetical protein
MRSDCCARRQSDKRAAALEAAALESQLRTHINKATALKGELQQLKLRVCSS